MRTVHYKWLSIFLSIPAAFCLAPVLVHAPGVNYFLIYSLFSSFENVFLLTAISTYGLSQLIFYRLRYGYWRAVFHQVVFYFIAAEAVLVMGLASLALLWVMPMSMLLFSDNARENWFAKSPTVNS
ncbi:MAG: hypothetical protein EOO68_14500 [Moraxellaceae bacterium]|nr:MAG: hypothetical protein EOO68_14500 [Moraxellaceae bacterium]